MGDKIDLLKRTKLFVLDMDGTFYLGDQILEGSLDFLEAAKQSGCQYLFFTNNSSKSSDNYSKRKIIGVYKNGNHSGIINVGMCFVVLNCNK